MRYEVKSYKFRGREFFRVIDTSNGGKIVASGLPFDSIAIGRRDELNACITPKSSTTTSSTTTSSTTTSSATLAEESLKTPRDASAAATLIAAACFNDEIRAIVARQLLRSIVR